MLGILFVDDEPHLQVLIKHKFRQEIAEGKYNVYFAAHGVEALDILSKNQNIDVVITDINMPEMDGIELFNAVIGKYSHVHVVLMSAYLDIENVSKAIKCGEYEFFSKPLNLDDIAAYLQRCKQIPSSQVIRKASTGGLTMEQELQVAYAFQKSMLPTQSNVDQMAFEIEGYMAPAKGVSGDMYDFFPIDSNHLGIIIADVSGQGIVAALFMSVFKTIVRLYSGEIPDPAKCLITANNYLIKHINNPSCMFVAAFYGILETDTGHFTYTNAGHIAPITVNKNGVIKELNMPNGMVIGVQGQSYINYKVRFNNNDILFLYTDGVINCMDHNKNNLINLLKNNYTLSAKNIVQSFSSYLVTPHNQGVIKDDATTVALKWKV